MENAIHYARWKHVKKWMLKNSSRPRQACGAKMAAEGLVITVHVHSV